MVVSLAVVRWGEPIMGMVATGESLRVASGCSQHVHVAHDPHEALGSRRDDRYCAHSMFDEQVDDVIDVHLRIDGDDVRRHRLPDRTVEDLRCARTRFTDESSSHVTQISIAHDTDELAVRSDGKMAHVQLEQLPDHGSE